MANGQSVLSFIFFVPPTVSSTGPKAPKGKEKNWLETIPGKSWFTILRMCGPLKPWLDKTWLPGEIEMVK